mgnify:CR=1 FL=1
MFEARYRADSPDFLLDHVIHGVPVMPGAGFVSAVLSAVEDAFRASSCVVEGLTFLEPMTLPEGEERAIQVVLTPDAGERPTQASVQIVSAARGTSVDAK